MVAPSRSVHRWATPVALLVAAALTLTACGGGGGGTKSGSTDPTTALATAKTMLDTTSGVGIELHTDDLPDGVSGIVKASGVGTHAPAFDGTLTVTLAGTSVDVPVVAVDGVVYAKIPFAGGGYQPIKPADYGAPDPAKLLGTDAGFSALLPATTGVEAGKSVRGGKDNKEILTQYTGTVTEKAVKNIIPTSTGDFDATYSLTGDDQLREVTLTGLFYGSGHDKSTYTVEFDDYGQTPAITKPA